MTTPPSPSSCNGSDVFFNFNDLRSPQTDDFYGSPRTHGRLRSNSFPMPNARFDFLRLFFQQKLIKFPLRIRLTSQGHEMTDDEDDSTDESFPNTTNLIHEHCNYMAARENLQEFAGRVPQRKRKRESENSQQDSNKPKVRNIFCSSIPSSKKKNTESEKGRKKRNKKNFHILTPNIQHVL